MLYQRVLNSTLWLYSLQCTVGKETHRQANIFIAFVRSLVIKIWWYTFFRVYLGAEYLFFVSSRSLKTREKYTNWDNLVCLSLYIFWAQSHLCLLLQTKDKNQTFRTLVTILKTLDRIKVVGWLVVVPIREH